jgi:hypothetical protein
MLRLERSVEEAHLFMDINPCSVCGESEFNCQSAVVMAEGALASRYRGECAGCGLRREFVFRLPDQVPLPSTTIRFGGPEPSELLDAGEWLWAARNFADVGPLNDIQMLTDQERAQAQADLEAAVAALDEVLKFLPGEADEVPVSAFWSERGHLVLTEDPGQFERDRLFARRDRYRAMLTGLGGEAA